MKKEARMSVINPNACGIDVGSKLHYVATGQGSEEVRSFGVYTKDHQEMVAYLQSKGVKTIAMESTGNYWQTLFAALEKAGFEVFLVCGNQTKNVKAGKRMCKIANGYSGCTVWECSPIVLFPMNLYPI